MNKTFDDIRKNKFYMNYTHEDELQWVEKIEFDSRNASYLMLKGRERIAVIDFAKKTSDQTACREKLMFNLNSQKQKDMYERIYDAKMQSQNVRNEDDGLKFKIYVACKVRGQKQIDILRAFDNNRSNLQQENSIFKRSLTFQSENYQNLTFKISTDFKKAILVNDNENYIIENEHDVLIEDNSKL